MKKLLFLLILSCTGCVPLSQSRYRANEAYERGRAEEISRCDQITQSEDEFCLDCYRKLILEHKDREECAECYKKLFEGKK